MLRLCTRILLFSSALVIGIPVQAGIIRFEAHLTHDQEVINPPIPNEGSSGFAVFFLNDAQTRLTYDIQLTGLDLGAVKTDAPNKGLTNPPAGPGDTADPNDDVLRGHIHRAIVGLNGGIVFGFIDNGTALLNDQNDLTVDKATLHITGAWDLDEGNPTGIAGPPPSQSTLATELNNLLNGGLYINFHTRDHAGGEIRGQILQAPEPAPLALVGLGLVGLALSRRRMR